MNLLNIIFEYLPLQLVDSHGEIYNLNIEFDINHSIYITYKRFIDKKIPENLRWIFFEEDEEYDILHKIYNVESFLSTNGFHPYK